MEYKSEYQDKLRDISWDKQSFAHLDDVLCRLAGTGENESTSSELVEILSNQLTSLSSFKRLHAISTKRHSNIESLFQDYLKAGCEILGLEIGIISQINQDNQEYTVKSIYSGDTEIEHDDVFDLGETYCTHVVQKRETVTFAQVETVPEIASHPVYQYMKLESYIGTPIIVDDNIYGTLNFSSTKTVDTGFLNAQIEFIELTAQNIAHALHLEQEKNKRIKIMQERIRQEHQLRLFIKHTPAAIAMFDKEMRYLVASDRWLSDYGVEQDVIGKSHYEVFPEIGQEWKEIHKDCLKGKVAKRAEDPFMRDDGRTDWIRWEIHPWYQDDQVGGIIMFTEVITERKETELKLQQSETLYRALTDHLPGMAVIMFDRELRYTIADGPLLGIAGYSRDEMVGKSICDVLPEEAQTALVPLYQKVLEGESFAFQRKTNGMHYDSRFTPVKDNVGIIIGGLITVQDVTEQKQLELALNRTADSLKRAEAVANVGHWEVNLETGVNVWSDEFFRICGLEPQSVEPSSELGFSLIHPEDTEKAAAAFEETQRTGEAYRIEKRIIRPNGNIRWVLSIGDIIEDELTKTKKLVGMFIDITERKKIEDLLSQQYVELERFFSVALDLLCIANNKGEFVRLNTAWERVLDYPIDELEGSQFLDLVHPDDLQPTMDAMQQLDSDQPILRFINRYKRKDGKYRVLEWRASPYGEFYYAAARDITEQKEYEQEIEAINEDLREANKEVQQFAYIVSHDLRAPLINLKGFSSMLESSMTRIMELDDRIVPLLDEKEATEWEKITMDKVPTAIRFINNSVERLDTYTSAILKLSRLGKRELHYEPVVTHELVTQIIQLFETREQDAVIFQIDDLPTIVADRMALDQILTNIITNAVKYTSSDRQSIIRIYSETTPNQTIFHIKDNGIGISASDHDRVFAPFRRAGKPMVEGEGMGLAYVQALVKKHGGDIWFESSVNIGTTFSFTIPARG